MGQVDFAYAAAAPMGASAAGLVFDVSIFADRSAMRDQLVEDVAAAGLGLHECGTLAMLADGDPRALGDGVLLDCPRVDGTALAALARLDTRAARSGAQLVISTSVGGAGRRVRLLFAIAPGDSG